MQPWQSSKQGQKQLKCPSQKGTETNVALCLAEATMEQLEPQAVDCQSSILRVDEVQRKVL